MYLATISQSFRCLFRRDISLSLGEELESAHNQRQHLSTVWKMIVEEMEWRLTRRGIS